VSEALFDIYPQFWFCLTKIQDPRVAEQLVSFFHQDSVRGEAHNVSGAESIRVNELELEVERLASRSEHLRAQNDVLALTLAESRALGERLAVVLGKYSASVTLPLIDHDST